MTSGYGGALAALLAELGCDIPELDAESLDSLFGLPSVRVQAFLEWFLASVRPRHSVKRELQGSREYELFLALLRGEHGGLLNEEQLAMEEAAIQMSEDGAVSLDELLADNEALATDVARLERRLQLAEQKNERLAQLVQRETRQSDLRMQHEKQRERDAVSLYFQDIDGVANAHRSLDEPTWTEVANNVDAILLSLVVAAPPDGSEDAVMEEATVDAVDTKANGSTRGDLLYQQSLHALLDIERDNMHKLQAEVPKILAAMSVANGKDAETTKTQPVAWLQDADPQQLQLREQDIPLYNRCCVELARLEKAFAVGEADALCAQLEVARAETRVAQHKDPKLLLVQQYELMSTDAVEAKRSALERSVENLRQEVDEYAKQRFPRLFEELAFLHTTSVLVGSYEHKLWRQERRFLQLRALIDAFEHQHGRLRLTHRLLDEERAGLQRVDSTFDCLSVELANANENAQERMTMYSSNTSVANDSRMLLERTAQARPIQQLARSSLKDTDEVAHVLFDTLEQITSTSSDMRSGTSSTSYRFRTFEDLVRLSEQAKAADAITADTKSRLAVEWEGILEQKRATLTKLRHELFGDATSATPKLLPSRLALSVAEVVASKEQAEAQLHDATEDLRLKKRSLAMDPTVREQQRANFERLRGLVNN